MKLFTTTEPGESPSPCSQAGVGVIKTGNLDNDATTLRTLCFHTHVFFCYLAGLTQRPTPPNGNILPPSPPQASASEGRQTRANIYSRGFHDREGGGGGEGEYFTPDAFFEALSKGSLVVSQNAAALSQSDTTNCCVPIFCSRGSTDRAHTLRLPNPRPSCGAWNHFYRERRLGSQPPFFPGLVSDRVGFCDSKNEIPLPSTAV